MKKNFNTYLATFNKIDGVSIGTDVVISGIKVGEVKEILIKKLCIVLLSDTPI